ncbi:TrbI/VirB10 family protein [Acidithiobacillus ferridurans]|uniref:TrbI/VirB10 family protein n=1 Tax=Acidithiobacillus ferridurans TaxID=1232575 RepID=UPI001C06747D|nr:TrbI/VirB10 family protein [Acidithiobacillus ferridurans]MBU2719360.1 TrbI/VirB10 family protein [Acidithiobacillus ferridurans]MBU2733470.1 TrbI/VirB10 family protein [Acidithiobacillus ferridurans]
MSTIDPINPQPPRPARLSNKIIYLIVGGLIVVGGIAYLMFSGVHSTTAKPAASASQTPASPHSDSWVNQHIPPIPASTATGPATTLPKASAGGAQGNLPPASGQAAGAAQTAAQRAAAKKARLKAMEKASLNVSGFGSTQGAPVASTPAAAPLQVVAHRPKPQGAVPAASGPQGKFLAAAAAKHSDYLDAQVEKPISPYELQAGTVIPATLITGIKSGISGLVTAMVRQPVYGSINGRYVLVPAGTKIIGTYDDNVLMAQKRVLVAWTRMIFPNGSYINIGGMPGAGLRGYAGLHDLVNNHYWTVFKDALLLSMVNVGIAMSQPQQSVLSTQSYSSTAAQALASEIGQVSTQILTQAMNIAPTLTIRPGFLMNVMVTKDIVFPGPYKS